MTKVKWLNRLNEETGQEEKFYPVTHKEAVIGLDEDFDSFVQSEAFDGVEGEEPSMPTVIANKFAEVENRIQDIEADLNEYIIRLSKI